MRAIKRTVGFAFIAVAVFGAFGAANANCGSGTTCAGSTKGTDGQIHCGTTGNLPTGNPGGIRTSVNSSPDGAEVEACNDGGPGNTQGRAVVQASSNSAHPGARLILDTDHDQPFPAGYIIVQASSDHPGVWCNNEGNAHNNGEPGTAEPESASDGYKHSWSNPGTQGGPGPNEIYCIPQN